MMPIFTYNGVAMRTWRKLVGEPAEFAMENRIFNAVSLLTLVALFLFALINYITGLKGSGYLMVIGFLLQGWLYYLSRYRKRFLLAGFLYCIATYIFLAGNFYLNDGVNGPTVLSFIVVFILFIAVTPPAQHWAWICLHILVLAVLLVWEYTGHIPNTYNSFAERLTDIGITYSVLLVCLFFVIRYIRRNYNREKLLAEERAESMGKLNGEINRLFSIISHDLRAPLNSVQGYLELLSDQALTGPARQALEQQLLEQTKLTQELLFNLLTWSKSKMAGTAIELQSVNLAEALAGTITMLKMAAGRKNIQLQDDINPDAAVYADAAMLQVIVRNLVHNAIKFTPDGGLVEISCQHTADRWVLTIKDNGPGIPLNRQAEIFTTQIKSTAGTRKEKGIGLGLYLCRELTVQMKGTISFTSAPGKGSVFFLAFPAV